MESAALCMLSAERCALCTVHCAVCTVQCALCTVNYALCSSPRAILFALGRGHDPSIENVRAWTAKLENEDGHCYDDAFLSTSFYLRSGLDIQAHPHSSCTAWGTP